MAVSERDGASASLLATNNRSLWPNHGGIADTTKKNKQHKPKSFNLTLRWLLRPMVTNYYEGFWLSSAQRAVRVRSVG